MKITTALLTKHGACPEQVQLFETLWPTDGIVKGATTTTANLRRAVRAGLTIQWVERFIPAPLLATYEAGRAQLWANYEAGHAQLLATYEADRAPLLATYEAGRDTLWATYEAGRAPLWATYEAGHAQLLAKALANAKGA